jgi:tRNA dimethylallyltransferase
MVAEVRRLRAGGLSWQRLENFGLEYRHIARHLQGKISKTEMSEAIVRDSLAFARRQVQWWKHDPRVVWITGSTEAILLAKKLLK